PSVNVTQSWHEKTPDGFRFSLKVPQTITHEKILLDCRKELNQFMTAARALEEKLLCCLFQFGYFNPTVFPHLPALLDRLDPFPCEWPQDVPVAVEIRNKTWFTTEFASCLRKHNAVWAVSDQAWTPPPLRLVKALDVLTGPFAYLRLLGDRAEVDRL